MDPLASLTAWSVTVPAAVVLIVRLLVGLVRPAPARPEQPE